MSMKETQMTGQMVYQAQRDLANMIEDTDFRVHQVALVAKAQAEIGGPVYRIPAANVEFLKSEIENKVNKRAAKLQLPPVEIIELEQEIIEREVFDNDLGRKVTKKNTWQYVAIKGETPKIAGYNFIATLQHEEAGNIIRQIPVLRKDGEEIQLPDLSKFRHVDPQCDHCGLTRNRKDTYLVWNQDSGTIEQVGSNCLGDFLGAADPQRYASYAEYLRDFLIGLSDEEGEYYGPRMEREFSMREYLASVSRIIRDSGWVPASRAGWGEQPTKSLAWWNLVDYGKKDKSGRPLWIDIEEQDEKLADEVIEWANTTLAEREDKNDYEFNLHVALQAKGVTERTSGIVASAVSAFSREREREIKYRERKEAAAKSEFVGEVDKRSDFTLTLTRTHWIEDNYNGGTKPLYIFQDENGNAVKWFSSRDLNLNEGETYEMVATVKQHEDHSTYGKSTVITRAKVVG
jgi:hypothetical protein